MLPLTYLAEHNSASEVFTTFANGGGWYTTGLAVMIGLNGNAGAFIGTDGAVHVRNSVYLYVLLASLTHNRCQKKFRVLKRRLPDQW